MPVYAFSERIGRFSVAGTTDDPHSRTLYLNLNVSRST